MGERIVFTIAAATAIACAVLVITQKSPFRATVALIGTLLSIATGYPVGLLSNYTGPRGSWKLYREREATWAPIISAREDGWTVGVAGAF